MQKEGDVGICVIPDWPTQGWYAKALEMLKQEPAHINARKNLLVLPSHTSDVHPLWHKLNLLVCLLSGTA